MQWGDCKNKSRTEPLNVIITIIQYYHYQHRCDIIIYYHHYQHPCDYYTGAITRCALHVLTRLSANTEQTVAESFSPSQTTITMVDRVLYHCLFVGCLTSQQQASVSLGRICSDNFTCCHTETEVAHQTFYLTQSQYTDTGLTSPSAHPITPGALQGSNSSAYF